MGRIKRVFSIGIILVFLAQTADAQTFYYWRKRSHATDITTISDGKAADLGLEEDSNTLWRWNTGTSAWDQVSISAETDPLAWLLASDQTGITGDKSGSFDITTTGNITIGADTSLLSFGNTPATDYTVQWSGSQAIHTLTSGSFLINNTTVSTSTNDVIIRGLRPDILFDMVSSATSGGLVYDIINANITNGTPTTIQAGRVGVYGGLTGPTSNYMFFDSQTNGAYNNAVLKVDSNFRVGIGLTTTNRPAHTLDVNGDTRILGNVGIGTAPDATAKGYFVNSSVWAKIADSYSLSGSDGTYSYKLASNADSGIGFQFSDGSSNYVYMLYSGNHALKAYYSGSGNYAELGTVSYSVYGYGDAYFTADVSALTFTDRTPAWTGTSDEALRAITQISSKDGEIDHSTLPEFTRRKVKEVNQDTKEVTEVDGRDLGATITMLCEAVKALNTKIEAR